MKRVLVLLGCTTLFLAGPLVPQASAQGPPGQALVEINTDCSVTLRWAPAVGPVVGYSIIAQVNGIPVGTFPVGNVTTVRSGPLGPGNYLIAVIANFASGPPIQGAPTSWILTCGGGPPPGGVPPAVPNWLPHSVIGNTVTVNWTPVPNATSYDIEAVWLQTGQVFPLSIGNQSSLTVGGVPAGTFQVRIRARNPFGVSAFSPPLSVVVGITLGAGDMQVTLTWNQANDIDLHVIEPNGSHVYYASKTGTTAFLDVDNVTGFGPENVFVRPGLAAPGNYQIFIVHYSGSVPTTETISIVLGAGTANQRVQIYQRQTTAGNPSVGYNVATVNIGAGTITEVQGTRPSADLDMRPKETEPAAAAAGGSR